MTEEALDEPTDTATDAPVAAEADRAADEKSEQPGTDPDDTHLAEDTDTNDTDDTDTATDTATDEGDTDAADTDTGEAEDAEEASAGDVSPLETTPPSAGRRLAWALVRTVVVVGVSAVAYQLVVPQTNVVRAHLSRLVIAQSGAKAFPGKPANQGQQQASTLDLKQLTTSTKQSPGRTGAYGSTWEPSQTEGAQILAVLLPSAKEATTASSQLISAQLSAAAYKADGFVRKSTFTVSGVPGSSGSYYEVPKSASAPAAQLAVTTFRVGKTASILDVVLPTGAQAAVTSITRAEFARLQSVEPGFTLDVTTRSTPVTAGWAAGTVVLAALIGFGPYGWRAKRRRKERRIQDELDHQVLVGSRVITKRRNLSSPRAESDR